jgi:hypothetical protein
MTAVSPTHVDGPTRSTDVSGAQLVREVFEELRVLVVAGVSTGAVVIGGGSRLVMLVLRLTSPDNVNGVVSDDGFTIGRVTLAGTYNLLLLGAAAGIIGAAAYRMVSHWLLGPLWFRRVTTGLGAGVVVGAMLVHADGIDFTRLKPTWLAIALFVALPFAFGAAIGVAVDSVAAPRSWTRRGAWRWLAPIVLVACFPPTLLFVAISLVVLACWVPLRHVPTVEDARASMPYGLVVRAVWLSIAVLGLVALLNDIADIAEVT